MPWLVRDGEVLAAAEVARTGRERTRGLLGRDGVHRRAGVPPVPPGAHASGMRFAIDVAFCDADGVVIRTC